MENRRLDRPFVWSYDLTSNEFREFVADWPASAYGETSLRHIGTTDISLCLVLEDYSPIFDNSFVREQERQERCFSDGLRSRPVQRHHYRMPVEGGTLTPSMTIDLLTRKQLEEEYDCVAPIFAFNDKGYVLAQCLRFSETNTHYVVYDVPAREIVGEVIRPADKTGAPNAGLTKRFGDRDQFLATTEECKAARPLGTWPVLKRLTPGKRQRAPSSPVSWYAIRVFQLSPVFREVGMVELESGVHVNKLQEMGLNELLVFFNPFFGPPPAPRRVSLDGFEIFPIRSLWLKCVATADEVALESQEKTYWFTTASAPGTCSMYSYKHPLKFHGSLLYIQLWPDTYPAFVISPYAEKPERQLSAVAISGECIAINTDGSLLATAQPNEFRIWSIDFPDIREVASCRLTYDPESRRVVLAGNEQASSQISSAGTGNAAAAPSAAQPPTTTGTPDTT
ncbi:MAG TPA: hypothetical protein HPP83_03310 [Candidatus Hydrogenedentes bacterium]|nr:hypothetical protein [Candidatus Hydrogenedentota bacterium]